ncbi:hypothetical protein [Streptosporangium canum]|uniref:hypothetical protein n=1 Tax=Streptosporangium canum TaxID=324952 RepID=UPI0037AC0056
MTAEFRAVWVEGIDLPEIGRRLGADLRSAQRCGLIELIDGLSYDDGTAVIWADRLNNDWIQVIEAQGRECSHALTDLSARGGRAIRVGWGLNGVADLVYSMDGEETTVFSVTVPGERWGKAPGGLDPYATGLRFDLEDTSWKTDPDLPSEWMAFAEWAESSPLSEQSDADLVLPEGWWDFYEMSLNGYDPAVATCVTSALVLIGRMTGREIDDAWLSGAHTRLAMPVKL